MGFGRQLMAAAELEARKRGFKKAAVISGVGTRNYYRKLGYEIEGAGEFSTKILAPYHSGASTWLVFMALVVVIALLMGLWGGQIDFLPFDLATAAGGKPEL